jgi:hypothetical protein
MPQGAIKIVGIAAVIVSLLSALNQERSTELQLLPLDRGENLVMSSPYKYTNALHPVLVHSMPDFQFNLCTIRQVFDLLEYFSEIDEVFLDRDHHHVIFG